MEKIILDDEVIEKLKQVEGTTYSDKIETLLKAYYRSNN